MRFFLVVILFLVAACGTDTTESTDPSPAKPDGDPVVDTAHNSRNALDWSRTYTGILPCADCEGIQTTVTLRDDGTFDREILYLGKSSESLNDAGQFSWNDAGSIVTLAATDGTTQMYQVGESQLFHLDRAGNRISGDLAARYVLRQTVQDPRIEGRKWLLTEVMGQAYAPSDDGREAFLFLDGDLNRASGNASCNNFFSGYLIEPCLRRAVLYPAELRARRGRYSADYRGTSERRCCQSEVGSKSRFCLCRSASISAMIDLNSSLSRMASR